MKRLGLLLAVVALCSSGDAQSIKSGYKLTVDSGTTNTGNAAVTDVALGKTFSSSILTNSTGTSTKNATVPGGATILPAQAWVDNIEKVYTYNGTSGMDLSTQSITHFDPALLFTDGDNHNGRLPAVLFIGGVSGSLNLSGNALSSSEVNGILAAYRACNENLGFDLSVVVLNLNGGTNGAPTGQGITDKAYLISQAATVTTN